MEIKMVSCPNGHYYNASIHATCPQCGNQPVGATEFAPGVPVMGATEAVGGSTSGPTMPLGGGAYAGMGGTVGPTQPDGAGPTFNGDGSDGKTIIGGLDDSFSQGSQEPVVGWLVCISGPMRGQDFRIHAGYNYIGRQAGDVRLPGDNQISRQNHAMIAYDGMDHTYFFGPSGGRNLVRVNGKTVFNAVEIHNYDVITVGTSHLMFVGLCGSHFDWNGGRSNG